MKLKKKKVHWLEVATDTEKNSFSARTRLPMKKCSYLTE